MVVWREKADTSFEDEKRGQSPKKMHIFHILCHCEFYRRGELGEGYAGLWCLSMVVSV